MSGRLRRGREVFPPPAAVEPSRTTGPVPIVVVIVRPRLREWSAGRCLLVPGQVDGLEHALDVTLPADQTLDAGRERVVDGRVRPALVRQRGVVAVLQQVLDRL